MPFTYDPKNDRVRPGWQGQILIGRAGQTASAILTDVTDLVYSVENVTETITGRGYVDSQNNPIPPVESNWIVERKPSIQWSMLHKQGDDNLYTCIAAARIGAKIAIVVRACDPVASNGKNNGNKFDGDCVLSVTHEMTLAGQSIYHFDAKPNDTLRQTLLNSV